MTRKISYVVTCLIGMTFLLISLATATNNSIEPVGESDSQTLVLKLTSPDSSPVWAGICEEQPLTMKNIKTGAGYSFTSTISGVKKDTVELKIDRIEPDGTLKEIEKITISVGDPRIASATPYQIEVLSLKKLKSNPAFKPVAYSPAPFEKCCLTCNGTEYCNGCFVRCGGQCCHTSSPGCENFCDGELEIGG